MAKRRTKGLVYSPEERPYDKKSNSYVLNSIKSATQLRALIDDIGSAQWQGKRLVDHQIALYMGSHELNIPEDKRYVDFDSKSSKAPDIIHRVGGILSTPIQPIFVPPDQEVISQNDAGVIERHIEGAYEWFKRYTKQDFQAQGIFWQLLVGRSYIQQTYLPNYWDKNFRQRKKGEEDAPFNARMRGYKAYKGPPFMVESLDPRIVMAIPGPRGPRAFVKRYVVQRFEAEQAFADAGCPIDISQDKDGKISVKAAPDGVIAAPAGQELPEESRDSATANVTYYEYIDERFVYYAIEDQVIHSYDHKGGIKIAVGHGITTGFKEWELASVGILYAVRNEIPQLDFLRTLWVNRAYIDVFPQLFAELGPGENPIGGEDQPTEWKIEPMTIKQVRGKITNAFRESNSGVDYRAVIAMLGEEIDSATLPPVGRGAVGAQQPGYNINQALQSMRTVWKTLITSTAEQWSELYEHYLWVVKNLIKGEVSSFTSIMGDEGHTSGEYLSIDGKSIPDFYHVRVNYQPDLPIDKQGNAIFWMKANMEGHATDEETAREGFQRNDWRARRRQITRDRGRRFFEQQAFQDAQKLGQMQLTNKMVASQGLDSVNAPFSQSLEAMNQDAGMTPTTGGPGQSTPAALPPGPAGQPPAMALTAGGGTAGANITPTAGANPMNPNPGPRG